MKIGNPIGKPNHPYFGKWSLLIERDASFAQLLQRFIGSVLICFTHIQQFLTERCIQRWPYMAVTLYFLRIQRRRRDRHEDYKTREVIATGHVDCPPY